MGCTVHVHHWYTLLCNWFCCEEKAAEGGEGISKGREEGALKRGRGIHKFLTLSTLHCDVIENKVYFNLFLDQGGVPFLLKFYSGLPDGLRSGWARFGDSEPVELSRFNDRDILTGLNIPPSCELSKCYQLFCSLIEVMNKKKFEPAYRYLEMKQVVIYSVPCC